MLLAEANLTCKIKIMCKKKSILQINRCNIEVYLASKARVLSMSVATLALQVLLLDDLTGRLMLKLVVLKHRVQMTWYF